MGAFVIVFAAYMFVDGVFAIISGIRAARSGENWGLLILEGVVDLAAGAIAVLLGREKPLDCIAAGIGRIPALVD